MFVWCVCVSVFACTFPSCYCWIVMIALLILLLVSLLLVMVVAVVYSIIETMKMYSNMMLSPYCIQFPPNSTRCDKMRQSIFSIYIFLFIAYFIKWARAEWCSNKTMLQIYSICFDSNIWCMHAYASHFIWFVGPLCIIHPRAYVFVLLHEAAKVFDCIFIFILFFSLSLFVRFFSLFWILLFSIHSCILFAPFQSEIVLSMRSNWDRQWSCVCNVNPFGFLSIQIFYN